MPIQFGFRLPIHPKWIANAAKDRHHAGPIAARHTPQRTPGGWRFAGPDHGHHPVRPLGPWHADHLGPRDPHHLKAPPRPPRSRIALASILVEFPNQLARRTRTKRPAASIAWAKSVQDEEAFWANIRQDNPTSGTHAGPKILGSHPQARWQSRPIPKVDQKWRREGLTLPNRKKRRQLVVMHGVVIWGIGNTKIKGSPGDLASAIDASPDRPPCPGSSNHRGLPKRAKIEHQNRTRDSRRDWQTFVPSWPSGGSTYES